MNNDPNSPRPFSDITGPAGAPPASKPVITPPPQADPMLAVNPVSDFRPAPSSVRQPNPMSAPAAPVASGAPVGLEMGGPPQGSASQAPYFGHVGKRRKAGRRILITLIALIIVGGLGYGTYWYVQKNTPSTGPVATIQQDEESNSGAEQESQPSLDSVDIPEGYTTFTNSDLGYSFAFPSQLGAIEYQRMAGESVDKLRVYRSANQMSGIDGVTGRMMITLHPDSAGLATALTMRNNEQVLSFISYKDGEWVHDTGSPGGGVGTPFVDLDGKKPVATEVDGFNVYRFRSAVGQSLVFDIAFVAKNRLNVIQMPVMNAGTEGVEAPVNAIADNLIKTLRQTQ